MGDLNKQLQELQARVTQAENSIVAHHQGISQLVDALSSNPFTATAGAVGKLFYDGSPITFQMLLQLVGKGIPSYNDITNQLSSAVVKAAGDAIEQTIDQIAKQIEEAIAQQIKQLTDMLNDYIKQLDEITKDIKDLSKKISETSDPEEKAKLKEQQKTAEEKKVTLTAGLENVQKTIEDVLGKTGKAIKAQILGFIKSQKDLSKGKSQSLDLTTG